MTRGHLLKWENESLQELDNNKLEEVVVLINKFCVGNEP